MTDYTSTFKLPTLGYLYKNIPGEITVRSLTTQDEKKLYGSMSSKTVSQVIQGAITEPSNIDLGEILPMDEVFILLMIRIASYGPEYTIRGKCPTCGKKHDYHVNLNELDVTYLNEDFKEPIKLTLPRSQAEVEIKLLRKKDNDAIENRVKRMSKKSNQVDPEELAYTLRLARMIVSINGNSELEENQILTFINKLQSYDSLYIRDAVDELVDCGVDSVFNVECPSCGEEFDLAFTINSEFFRPRLYKSSVKS